MSATAAMERSGAPRSGRQRRGAALDRTAQPAPRAPSGAAGYRPAAPSLRISAALQPKVAVGAPGDRFEQEADLVALDVQAGHAVRRISRAPAGSTLGFAQRQHDPDEQADAQAPEAMGAASVAELAQTVQRQAAGTAGLSGEEREATPGEEEQEAAEDVAQTLVQRCGIDSCDCSPAERAAKEGGQQALVQGAGHRGGAARADGAVEGAIDSSAGGGPLRGDIRERLEQGTGYELGDVRVHQGGDADRANRELHSRAFTHGRDIWLGAGESPDDLQLMAHESAHVVQQSGPAGGIQRVQRQLVQRQPDDPAVVGQFEDETERWEDLADDDDSMMMRALANRIVLLRKHLPRPPLRTTDDLDDVSMRIQALAVNEIDTLQAFSSAQAEAMLAFYPKGFPLTWGGRIKAAMTFGVDQKAMLEEWQKALQALLDSSKALPPGIHQHGLPVPMRRISRLDDFRLEWGDARLYPNSPVGRYGRESIKYVQLRAITAFVVAWERIVDQFVASINDGTVVASYLDWKDFVDNKQTILRDLPARARTLVPEDPTQLQDEARPLTTTLPLKDAALLAGIWSAWAAIFGGMFQGWTDASTAFDEALTTASGSLPDGLGTRLRMAVRWAWENDYFEGAAKAWVDNFIENAPQIVEDMLKQLAVIIGLQFIPGVNLAVDAYLAITLGLDVVSTLYDIKVAIDRIDNAGSVQALQRAGLQFATVLVNGGIQILIALGTWGIGKSVGKIIARAKEIRATRKVSQAAAERQAFQELSAAERKPLEDAARKVGEFDKRYSPETKPILDTPGVRSKLASVGDAARKLLEFCDSPCLPPAHQLLEADLKLLEDVQKRLGRPGHDRALKEYFYNRRSAPGGLKRAIEDLNGVKKAADLDGFLQQEAKAAQAVKLGEARKLLDPSGKKFTDPATQRRYEDYLARKDKLKEPARSPEEWKVASDYWTTDSPMARGNAFNKTAGKNYDYNEVHLENKKRVDSYNPPRRGFKGEIVSRKASDFDVIDVSTFEAYLKELKTKYAPGKIVRSDLPRNADIDGKPLRGQLILEVPTSNQTAVNKAAFEAAAANEGIKIRYTPE